VGHLLNRPTTTEHTHPPTYVAGPQIEYAYARGHRSTVIVEDRGRRLRPLHQGYGATLDRGDLDSPTHRADVDAYGELVREQVREARRKADVN